MTPRSERYGVRKQRFECDANRAMDSAPIDRLPD
jgi:hypothetical protein